MRGWWVTFRIILSFSPCHQDHSSDRLQHDWNMGSEKHWHSVGVRSFCILPEMITTAGNYELERENHGYRTCCLSDFLGNQKPDCRSRSSPLAPELDLVIIIVVVDNHRLSPGCRTALLCSLGRGFILQCSSGRRSLPSRALLTGL